MFILLLTMLERIGIIVTVAFIMTRFRFFRQMIRSEKVSSKQQLIAIVFFGLFGIIGTYTGIALNAETHEYDRWVNNLQQSEAIANSRVVGIIIAGLFGGFRMGIGAGLIAGIHRFSLGGYTALACGVSAVVAGIIASFFHKKLTQIRLFTALLVGAFAEAVQMLLIVLIAQPFDLAVSLVEEIAFPMIVANGLGTALFLLIIQSVLKEEEKAGAVVTQKSLKLAEQTVPFLRQGLTLQSAKEVCQIIFKQVDASAISMTNDKIILAHVGLADDHHKPNFPIQTSATKKVLEHGKMMVLQKDDIHCTKSDCPLGAVVIAPLKQRGKTIGTLKFYFRSRSEISHITLELIRGLSALLSQQLELAEAEAAIQLAKEAEIKALQAQIRPHFLFNSMNIIISLIRTNPDEARRLLIELSKFFRQNLSGTTKDWTTIENELMHTKAYLSIEQARFIDKLTVHFQIDEKTLHTPIPPLTLQPIVENALKHGFKNKEKNCVITIHIKKMKDRTFVSVQDNGEGMDEETMNVVGSRILDSKTGTGLGLYNVNRRLTMMLGEKSALHIESEPNKGTTVSFIIYDLYGGEVD
ncbi:sensor histidine kinase [Bacillus sp. FJAT-47783]|uniref:sensor histidine kinase n=1 Tax=Bacillus sp. FJAT-47783 TaxID=2922712 RepID=UPI001FAB44B2|nr:sensor histidine kinase [Bacillus sp. FJAT-47783]